MFKKFFSLLLVFLPLICSADPTNNVSVNNSTNSVSILSTWDTITTWVSEQNTNIDLSKDNLEIFTSFDFVKNVQNSVSLGAWFKIYKNFGGELLFRNADVAGTIISESGGINYSYCRYDIKLIGGVDYGYNNTYYFTMVTPYAQIDKAFSKISCMFFRIGIDLNTKNLQSNFGKSPLISIGTTINF